MWPDWICISGISIKTSVVLFLMEMSNLRSLGFFDKFSKSMNSNLGSFFEALPAVNAINVLQASIYKSVKTGLFLQSFVDTSIIKLKIILLFCQRTLYLKVKTRIRILNLTTRRAITDFRNRPVLQTCKSRPVKCLLHWLQNALALKPLLRTLLATE